ncbi:beta-ketoacyl synthase N-terminal-like domain-containing protein [Sorangium sp. So ce1153]|uniref:type I polyketide synthase n=1 Tax=Sorangium sp. So ce1153 TaxID=3133333 RepID=UPI003F63B037
MTTEETSVEQNRIAIVGAALRFPGARTPDEYWRNLSGGVESVRTLSDEELEAAGVSPEEHRDPRYVRRKGILDIADQFDPRFFGIPPLEARVMDPQHRMFLECSWEALESAGYGGDDRGGRVGVYGGVGLNTYWLRYVTRDARLMSLLGGWQASILNDKDFVPTRASYHLDLRGPSVSVNTACSASLVAVHMACQSLLTYECDMALAGGVTVEFPQHEGMLYREGMVYAPDGRCRPFDAAGRGIVDGNGVGIVVLKRLDDALRDRDTIWAVILGSAINNDGAARVGYTAPSIEGQTDVVRQALAMAGCDADSIGYVEAHGTSTVLGDPIEVAALTQAFRETTSRKGFCGLGSVKSNLGHLDTAAGVAGLIKTALCLKHGQLVPSLHFEKPNPNIDFASSPFYVCTETRDWPAGATPRRAGVSSLGIGGTNAHVIVEEPPRPEPSESRRRVHVLPLSAKSEAALGQARERLARHLEGTQDGVADVAHTLQLGRRAFEHRAAVVGLVGQAREELVAALREGQGFTGAAAERPPSVVFMFPGQGSQHLGMSRELYEAEPTYRAEVDRCAQILRPALDLDLRALMFSTHPDDEARLRDTAIAQPALFVVEYALAQLWASWGVTPDAMIGHSIGELVAACLAGVFDLPDALRLVALRGRLMASTAPGSMLAVNLPEGELRAILPADLSVGVVNEPSSCVVSGPEAAMAAFERTLEPRGISHRRLHTSHAFHSTTMDPVVEAFVKEVARCAPRPAQKRYISNVTGTWIEPATAASPAYWGKHLRQTVRFADGIDALLAEEPGRTFIEVGPAQALSSMLKRNAGRSGAGAIVPSLPHPRTKAGDERTLAEALGKLWVRGHDIAWKAVHAEEKLRRVPLPTYAFDHQRCWVDPARSEGGRALAPGSSAEGGRAPGSSRAGATVYAPSWVRRAAGRAAGGASDRRWLVFLDRGGWGEALAERLRQGEGDVVVVRPGAAFKADGGRDFVVDPASAEHHRQLLEALDQGAGVPRRIVHLVGVERAASGDGGDAAQLTAFASLASLIGALGRREPAGGGHGQPIELTVVSNGAQSVTGEEDLDPGGAALLALVRAAGQEHAWLTCRSVDVSDRELGRAAWLPDRLVAEALSGSPAQLVAYRGKHRWEASYEPVAVDEEGQAGGGLRQRGRYLVLGGLGGAGLAIALHLAGAFAAELLLAEDPDAPAPADPRAASVKVIRARLDDPGELSRCVREAEARLGGLDGVVYAAGIEDAALFGGIGDLRAPDVVARLARHGRGLAALEAALEGRSLDLCAVSSSLSAILGGRGLAAYAACHLIRDAFVRRHNQRSPQRWIAVNWDRWLDGTPAGPSQGLDPAQALRALERLLAGPELDQVAVCSGDLVARLEQGRRAERDAAAPARRTDGDARPAAEGGDRPDLSTRYVAPRDEAEAAIAEVWRELLGIAQIGVEDDFFELGGHSLLATRFLVRLEEKLGTQLTITDFFQHPTIAALAGLARGAAADEVDPAELADLLAQVEGMSDDEALAALDLDGQGSAGASANHPSMNDGTNGRAHDARLDPA